MNKCYSIISVIIISFFFPVVALAQGPNGSGIYYQKAQGKKGAELKTALCGIIYNRKERGNADASYRQLWTDFKTTDVRPDGSIWDMYSGTSHFTPVADQDKGSHKEEGLVYNREHSFPKSWFGGKVMPMYTDLFHLYPTDAYVNEKRSDYPFGETNGEKYTSNGGFSKLGVCIYEGYSGTVFEPNDEYKGDFARTYFYMVTCYEEKLPDWYQNEGAKNTLDGNTYPGLTAWQLKMLLEWSAKDPVNRKEINRNNAVYALQENRNPFIDYPGLEDYIWGDKQDIAFDYENSGQQTLYGDANDDGEITVADIVTMIDYMRGTVSDGFNFNAADMNGDNIIDIADILQILTILLSTTK